MSLHDRVTWERGGGKYREVGFLYISFGFVAFPSLHTQLETSTGSATEGSGETDASF